MESWEKLIKAIAEIWAEEDIKAGYYKNIEPESEKKGGDEHEDSKRSNK